MSVKQISPGVYQISPSYYNVYLIDSDELILVDVGDPNSANAIQKAVQSIGKQMTDICHILLTHCHRDHAGGLAKIKQMTGAPVYMHPIEATAVRKGETRREFFKPRNRRHPRHRCHGGNFSSRHRVSSPKSLFLF